MLLYCAVDLSLLGLKAVEYYSYGRKQNGEGAALRNKSNLHGDFVNINGNSTGKKGKVCFSFAYHRARGGWGTGGGGVGGGGIIKRY